MDDIKKAYAWREALELSGQLVKICEEFSDVDTNVLVWHLREAVVDIPAGIAADLQAKRPATIEPVVKLVTELELVNKIYPAIETGKADEQLERLMQRMQSDGFSEREPAPEAEEPAADPQPEAPKAPQKIEVDGGDEAAPPQVDGVGRQPS